MLNKFFLLYSIVLLLGACTSVGKKESNEISVVASTEIVADALKNILPSPFKISTIIDGHTNPHEYLPTKDDLQAVANADLVVTVSQQLENNLKVITQSEALQSKLIRLNSFYSTKSGSDPHLWMDVYLWKNIVDSLSHTIAKRYPAHKEAILQKSNLYIKDLELLDIEIDSTLAFIPLDKRYIASLHNAFELFCNRYNFKPIALSSNVSHGHGLHALEDYIVRMKSSDCTILFREQNTSDKEIKAIYEMADLKKHTIHLDGPLLNESLDIPTLDNQNDKSYILLMRYNIQTIEKAFSSYKP